MGGTATSAVAKKTSTTSSWTGVTYRIIAAIPRLIAESENRESLAIKATTMMLEHEEEERRRNEMRKDSSDEDGIGGPKISLENSLTVFEEYARKLEAVETLLKRDRAQQQAVVRKLFGQIVHSPKKDKPESPISSISKMLHSNSSNVRLLLNSKVNYIKFL